MKKIIASVLFVIALVGIVRAQSLPIDANTEKVTFIEVADATGLTGKDLYTVLKQWGLSKGYKIKEEKESEGEIVFDATIPVDYVRVKGKTEPSTVTYNLYLMAKDNKYRYIGVDYVHVGTDKTFSGGKLENASPECGPSINVSNWNYIKGKTKSEMDALVEELKKKIKAAKNDPTKNKDW